MKHRSLLVAACAVVLFLPSLAGAQCQIQRAMWGAGGNQQDVTARVQSMVRGNQLYFRPDRSTLGDPAPGRTKTLTINCRSARGQVNNHYYQEGGTVNLQVASNYYPPGGNYPPGNQQGLRIVTAIWGYRNQTANVAPRLNSLINNGRLSFQVENGTFGVDPAPGQRKQLQLTYLVNGRQQRRTYQENDYARLP